MASEGEFMERVRAFRESRFTQAAKDRVDCSPPVLTEFLCWVFAQEALEREKREAKGAGKFLMQVAIDRAAVHVSELHVSQWPMWVSYFLECLDSLGRERGLTVRELEEFLTKVHKLASERVCIGSW